MEEWEKALEDLGGNAAAATAAPKEDWQKTLDLLGGSKGGQPEPAKEEDAEDKAWYEDVVDTAWDFVKDVGEALTVDAWQGAEDLTRQQRLLFNYVQGDNEELDRLLESGRASMENASQGRTIVGRWAKQAGSSVPYLAENITARVAGGLGGSVAGPAGTTIGQAMGGMLVAYSQGWGELFERLVNEGVDKDEAAKISFVLAAPYAGIEALQVGPILNKMGLGKYAAGAFSKKIESLIAKNPVLRSKVARALGDKAKGVLGESIEEGLQGGVMNIGEQWAHGKWDTAEFFEAVKNDTIESIGPMGITLGVAGGIGKYRQWRADKKLGKNQKEEFDNSAEFQPFVKRSWAKEIGTPIGVSSEMPQGEKERVVWATKFTKQDREEIFNKAGEMAQKDLDGYKAENPGRSEREYGEFLNAAIANHARELAVFAHNFKLRVADLDVEAYAFDRVFASKKANAQPQQARQEEGAAQNVPDMSEAGQGEEENAGDAEQNGVQNEPIIMSEAGTASDYEVLPDEAEFTRRSREADENNFGLGVNFNGKRFQFGVFDKNGDALGSAYEYNGEQGVKIAWRDEGGKARYEIVNVPRFRDRNENESSDDWYEKYIDWRGETLRRVVKAWETNSVEELKEDFAREEGGVEDVNSRLLSDVEDYEKYQKKEQVSKVKYDDLDDFLGNGIDAGRSTFYDFGKLSENAVRRIKEATGMDFSGYTHTLESYGVWHGEKQHALEKENLKGQIPIERKDWKLADKIVNEFDHVEKSSKKSGNGNEVLLFRKQIGDNIYYVAEIRTGRKKLVSAT
ncbi:MAG: hypothetical protein J6T16_04180, partial [Opitutales bacterium]|nr:hypothetical protein [Opitutales bacterium]